MDANNIDALMSYLESHPLVAVVLTVMVVLLLGSLLKKLVKIAFILLVVFLATLYWTNEEASSDEWRSQLDALTRKGSELLEKGAEKAVEKGKEVIEKAKEKGTEEVKKQLSDEN